MDDPLFYLTEFEKGRQHFRHNLRRAVSKNTRTFSLDKYLPCYLVGDMFVPMFFTYFNLKSTGKGF